MEKYTVRESTELQPDPDAGSKPVGTIAPGEELTGLKPLGEWMRVEVNRANGNVQSGWILAAVIEEIPGQTVKLYPEPFSDKFDVITGSVEWLNEPLENWRKATVEDAAGEHKGWINLNEMSDDGEPIVEAGDGNQLDLGVNEVYRRHLLKAQEITGIDAASLAALVDAEAGKKSSGIWNAEARNPRTSASGLTQFLKGTWLDLARKSSTLLNQVGKARGLITNLNAVASGRDKQRKLLDLRFDPEYSIVSAAEYGLENLKTLVRAGVIPAEASDDDKARFMYLAHHEGPSGAIRFLKGTDTHSFDKLRRQIGGKQRKKYLKASGHDPTRAYRLWLNDYLDKKIQPDRFRRKNVAGGHSVAVAIATSLSNYSGAAIPLDELGGRIDLVKEIQAVLGEQGYLDPPVDGLFGSVSKWALEEFCKENNLSLDDGFSPDIARALVSPANPLPDIKAGNTWFDRVIAYMNDKGYWICRHPGCTNIVYLEGANPDGTLNDDRPNVFNDLRMAFSVDGKGALHVASWEGTTEPGRRYTERPLPNVTGAARIAFGQYKSWVVGFHRKSSPTGHEALVQVRPVSVYRDRNKDYKRIGDQLDEGLFGINQHCGYDNPIGNIGSSSAGCLVGRTKSGHREFMRMLKEDARYQALPSYRFMTAILSGEEVLR